MGTDQKCQSRLIDTTPFANYPLVKQNNRFSPTINKGNDANTVLACCVLILLEKLRSFCWATKYSVQKSILFRLDFFNLSLCFFPCFQVLFSPFDVTFCVRHLGKMMVSYTAHVWGDYGAHTIILFKSSSFSL